MRAPGQTQERAQRDKRAGSISMHFSPDGDHLGFRGGDDSTWHQLGEIWTGIPLIPGHIDNFNLFYLLPRTIKDKLRTP